MARGRYTEGVTQMSRSGLYSGRELGLARGFGHGIKTAVAISVQARVQTEVACSQTTSESESVTWLSIITRSLHVAQSLRADCEVDTLSLRGRYVVDTLSLRCRYVVVTLSLQHLQPDDVGVRDEDVSAGEQHLCDRHRQVERRRRGGATS